MKILDPENKYMFPTEDLMKIWFEEFNNRFFEGKLEPIELKVGYLSKRTHGSFYSPPQERCPGVHPDKCSIKLNGRFFDCEDEWRNTLLHEMIHYAAYKESNGVDYGHGKTFKRISKRINGNSEFIIKTNYEGRHFQPEWNQVQNWEERCRRDFVIGRFYHIWKEDFEDEDTEEIIPIERTTSIATFKTTDAYIPEIIDNLSSCANGEIKWFKVTACCQRLVLIKAVNYTPDYHEEYLCNSGWFEDDIIDGIMTVSEYGPTSEFGPIECQFLGTTDISDGIIEGYSVGPLRSYFRQQYFRNAEEIGKLAANKLVSIYQNTPQWFKTSHHGVYQMKPSDGNYTIEADSRFIALVAMTPKKIQINPVRSDTMMGFIKEGDSESLAKEITRVIQRRER